VPEVGVALAGAEGLDSLGDYVRLGCGGRGGGGHEDSLDLVLKIARG
jgi:hypothetical protein